MGGRPSGAARRRTLVSLATVAAVATLLIAFPLLAGTIEQEWRYYKPVALPDSAVAPSLVELELDPEVYAHANPGLGDIRVTEQDGEEHPYKLLVEYGDQRRAPVEAKEIRDLSHVAGKDTTFILDLQSEGVLHNELQVQTSSEDFQRRVEVEGSDDGKSWRTLQNNGTIFALTIKERGFAASDTRVTYPDSTARFLRVRIIDDGLEPLNVKGGVVFFARQLEPRRADISIVVVDREEDAERKTTTLLMDAGSAGIPANRIELEIPRRNFHRQVSLEGSDDMLAWHTVQSNETLYDFDTPKFIGNDLSIGFGESRYRYYRATIANEDNPPLPVDGARASGFVRKLVFSADAAGSYRLYYGNPDAGSPSYDLERIFPYLVTEGLPIASLGPQTQNPAFFVPEPPPKPFTERSPWLLPVIVAIAALIIGAFLASLIRQLKGSLPPPAPPQ